MMANYGYYPQYYYPTQPNVYPTQVSVAPTQPTQNSGITWVQGESGAKSYLVGAGQSVLLMDSEGSSFYIKSTDNSGMPLPLRIFDYTERTVQTQPGTPAVNPGADFDPDKYVTKEEFLRWTSKVRDSLNSRRKEQKDAE